MCYNWFDVYYSITNLEVQCEDSHFTENASFSNRSSTFSFLPIHPHRYSPEPTISILLKHRRSIRIYIQAKHKVNIQF